MALFSVFKLLFVYLLLFVIPGEANIQQHSNRIERWAEQLSFEVNNVLEKNFGLTIFQSIIDQALYQRISSQGSELLNNISIAVDEKLQDVLRTLISNKVLLETELLKDRPFRTVNCCDRRGKLRYDARFRSNVDRNSSCVIPHRGNSYLTSRLEENYKRNVLSSKAIKWQYFGSNNGSYHQYPRSEHRCAKEGIFDPRLSPWYVDALMSTRKRLIIIIDQSGSMRSKQRMVLAKDAALTVLNTLTPDDYVTAIAFSTSPSFPPGCFGSSLAKATASNLQVLREWIRNLQASGKTMYSLAFETAFDCFVNSSSTDKGKNIILFLTDGAPSDDPSTKIYPSITQGQQQMNNSVSILAYGLGTGISGNINAKEVLTNIATENKGHFTIIKDGSKEKLNSAFGSYYQYFVTAIGNVALGKQASQSSVMLKQFPNLAVNGRVDGKCSQTNYEENPWWRVDLQDEYYIMAVEISNCCNNIVKNIEVHVGNNEIRELNKICGHIDVLKDKENHIILCPADLSGRYVHLGVRGRNKSFSICEVRVYQVLAPSLTLSMPCTNENGTMFGVSAVDISLSDVFSQLISLSYGQYSYAVVIDVKGRVWIHPRSPKPEESRLGPSLLPLQIYESWANKEIMKTILNQPSGHVKLNKILLQFPRGYSSIDGMKTKEVNGTVNWKRLRNMFILMIVMVEDDLNIWLTPRKASEEHSSKEADKKIDKHFDVCQVNGTPIFTQLSTVKITIKGKEDVNDTVDPNAFVETTPGDKLLIEEIQATHPGIVSDVVITGYLEKTWRGSDMKDDDSVMWRYVATESGVYRRYPGITMTKNINHKNSPWYRQALMNPGKSILSHSFGDPFGRGKVISISKAVLKNRQGHLHDNISNWQTWIMGVAGIDMTFSSFNRMAMNVMPGCLDEYDCFLMDQSGYLFVNLNEHHPLVHVTEKFSWIGKQLVETHRILKPRWCNDFVDFRIQFSYEVVVTETIISPSPIVCRQYILVPLSNVSFSLLVIPSRRIHLNCQDRLDNDNFEACHLSQTCKTCSQDVTGCQTPCSCPMSFDRCSNSIMNTFTKITCPAPTTNASLVNAALSDHKTWNSTKVPECEKVCNTASSKEECSEISHCSWCENIFDSCESFCPFNHSQRIGLKFNLDLNTLIPVLTDVIKIEIKKNLQQTMYNTLGEKLENNIHGINFKQNSITTTIQGSSMAEIYGKLDKINDAIASRTFSIDIPENGGRKTIIPKQLFVLDVNECLTNVNDCHINATCFDTEDYYNCSCKSGFVGNGRNCKDMDECDQFPCDDNAKCMNQIGSFKCSCLQGFTGNGSQCLDENECDQTPCHSDAICTNFPGSFNCSCLNGFFGNGTFCQDINECDQYPCDDNATCVNQVGSFKCSCLEGFDGNGFNCLDSNECEIRPCHSNASCTNVPGSFECSCFIGFSGDGFRCQDVNECAKSPCDGNATCINQIGSFKCSCLEGFTGNGFQCLDENECNQTPCHPHAVCTNFPGSSNCSCMTGFFGNGTFCQDMNECTKSPCDGNATCTNQIGSFECSCLEGFTGNGSQCLDYDECEVMPCHENASCTNTPGSYHCSCFDGYFGNGSFCLAAKTTERAHITETGKTRGTTEMIKTEEITGTLKTATTGATPTVHSKIGKTRGTTKMIETEETTGTLKTTETIGATPTVHSKTGKTRGTTKMIETEETTGTLKTIETIGATPTVHSKTGKTRGTTKMIETEETTGTLKTTATTGTTPTVHSGLDKSDDHHPTTTVIVLVITSFIIGISFGLCCIWFVLLRRSQRKNKVRPSSTQDDVEVNIFRSQQNDDVDATKNDKSKLFGKRGKTNSITSIKSKKSFQVVSTVRFELNEVEI